MPTAEHTPMMRTVPAKATKIRTGHSSSSGTAVTTTSTTSLRAVPSFVTSLVEGDPLKESTVSLQIIPVPRPDEPFLYDIPASLHPIYRPFSGVGKVLVAMFSILVAILTTDWKRKGINGVIRSWNFKRIVGFVIKALVTGIVTNFAAQEIFTPPSRIKTPKLVEQFYLPSSLSKYEPLAVLPNGETLHVHWLEYKSRSNAPNNTCALYMNHGFGASSLSWLPAIPSLVEELGCRIGLGHDAPGFGFTDRPKDLPWYTPLGSAQIATQLLKSRTTKRQPSPAVDRVILLGHSMGALATLHMAAALPNNVKKDVVLVDPALGMTPHGGGGILPPFPKWTRRPLRIIRQCLIDPPATYILRRAVGTKNFWRSGLRSVWGDSNKLSESDVLRFQWPSIGWGWEKGLLSFTGAQLTIPPPVTDLDLVQKVLALPNTTVTVLFGSKDKIVSESALRKFFDSIPPPPSGGNNNNNNVTIVELEGQGHDPFEEDVDLFVSTLKKILDDKNKNSV